VSDISSSGPDAGPLFFCTGTGKISSCRVFL
jgi:hypothetical protein